MLTSTELVQVPLRDLIIEKRPFAEGVTATIHHAKYGKDEAEFIFKKPKEGGNFALDGISQKNQVLLSAAISRVYGKCLPNHALVYDVVRYAGEPIGLMAPFIEMKPIAAEALDIAASLQDTRKRVAPKLLTRDFGRLLAVAYCLKESDFNDGNFVWAEGRVLKIDHDRSLPPEKNIIEQSGYDKEALDFTYLDGVAHLLKEEAMSKLFVLSEEALKSFPFETKKSNDFDDEFSPDALVHNVDPHLVTVFKEYLEGGEQEQAQAKAFVAGMSEGFREFAARAGLIDEMRAELGGVFEGEEVLLEEFLTRLGARQEAVAQAVSNGYVDHIAEAYGIQPMLAAGGATIEPRAASLSTVSEGLPSTSPSTVEGALSPPPSTFAFRASTASNSPMSVVPFDSPPSVGCLFGLGHVGTGERFALEASALAARP